MIALLMHDPSKGTFLMFLHQKPPKERPLLERRPKVADVAARAGVSTATVDRVINGRGGVHQKTVARVEEAIREIVGGRSPVLDPAHRFDVVLSGERGGGTKALADAFATPRKVRALMSKYPSSRR